MAAPPSMIPDPVTTAASCPEFALELKARSIVEELAQNIPSATTPKPRIEPKAGATNDVCLGAAS